MHHCAYCEGWIGGTVKDPVISMGALGAGFYHLACAHKAYATGQRKAPKRVREENRLAPLPEPVPEPVVVPEPVPEPPKPRERPTPALRLKEPDPVFLYAMSLVE